jgi:hypothetical protein
VKYSANGRELYEACVCLPLTGTWTADLRLSEGADVLSGAASLVLDGLSLRGTVVRAGASEATQQARIVGGAGGLAKSVVPKQYVRTPFSIIVRELLNAVGEQLSPRSDSKVLDTVEASWVVARQSVGEALNGIVRRLGASWRVESSGEVWIGIDSFPETSLERAALMADFPAEGRQVWGVERPALLPGVTFNSRRVVQVQHRCSAGRLRTEVWFER